MTHLKLELSISNREIVSDKIIKKLYELVSSGTLDNTSHLQGWLYVPVTYRLYQETITDDNSDITKDLTVDYGDFAIPFEDPNMITYLNSIGVGSNGTVTEGLAQSATIVANSANTTVTKFNELRYFTNITSSQGGWSGNSNGVIKFDSWTALEEVDISNFTSLGHSNSWGIEDTFHNCTSLTTVTASSKLKLIGMYAFGGCSSLINITGLSGTIALYGPAFSGCINLPSTCFSNVTFQPINGNQNWFYNCQSLTGLSFDFANITTIPERSFYQCYNLATINGWSSAITRIELLAFYACRSLTSIDLSNVTYIGTSTFYGCSELQSITSLANVTTLYGTAFGGCSKLDILNLSMPSLTTIDGSEHFKNTKVRLVSDLGTISQINAQMFANCASLTSVIIPSTCTQVSGNAFMNCTALTTVSTSSNILTKLEQDVFVGCTSLDTITGFDNVTSVGNNCFKDCSSLSSIDVDVSKLTSIGNNAFQNTGTALSGALTFSECLSIGQNAFDSCHNITELHFPKLTDVNLYYYWNHMNNLEVLDLPVATRLNTCGGLPKLTTINAPSATVFGTYGDIQFEGCPLLTTLNINFSAVTKIGGYAFKNDSGLAGQYFEFPNVTVVSQAAFTDCGINFIFSNNSVVLSATGGAGFLGYTGTIYVPDALLSDYQADSFWSRLGSNLLKGISQLPANYNS